MGGVRSWRNCVIALAVAALVGFVVAPVGAEPPAGPVPASACAPDDRPEPGLQGEVPLADELSGAAAGGYRCRIRAVSVDALDGLGVDTQMTWAGDCAYVVVPKGDAPSDGVAVLDVSDPADPVVVQVLRDPAWAGLGGQLGIHEGIDANEGRGVLVVPIGYVLSVYDIAADCRAPRLVRHFEAGPPGNLTKTEPVSWGFHSGQLSPDGTFFYGTDLGFGAFAPDGPCFTIIDLADPANPFVVTRWGANFPCHDLDFSPDGSTVYAGAYGGVVGHPLATVGAFGPTAQTQQAVNEVLVLDVSDVQARRPNPQIWPVGRAPGGRNHTEVFTMIGGRPYVIGAEEGVCPGGTGRIVDLSDPAAPVEVGEISIEVNEYPCPSGGPIGFGPMTHYLAVDDPADAKLAFITWYTAGLRVFDISDPTRPFEVAYYNPAVGNSTTTPRYLPDTGQIWFGGADAFHVLELDPALRRGPGAAERGWSVDRSVPVTLDAPAVRAPSARPDLYCTLPTPAFSRK